MSSWSSVDTAGLMVVARQLAAAASNTAQLAVGVGGQRSFHAASLAGACVLVPTDDWQGPAASAAATAAERLTRGLTALTWALGETAVALTQLATALAQAQADAATAARAWAGESVAIADEQVRAHALAAQAAECADARCAALLADITSAAAPLTKAGIVTAPTVSAPGTDIPPAPPRALHATSRLAPSISTAAAAHPMARSRLIAGSLRSARVVVTLPTGQGAVGPGVAASERRGWQVARVVGGAGRSTAVLRSTVPAPVTVVQRSPSAPLPAPSRAVNSYLARVLADTSTALAAVGGGALVVAGLVLVGGVVVAVTGGDARAIGAEIAWADHALAGLLSTAGCWQSFG